MKASNSLLKLATLVMILALLQSCATAPIDTVSPAPATQLKMDSADILHRVRPHERLGDIALTYTGNATNWEEIARQNGISNPRHLRVGAIIIVPGSLVLEQDTQNVTNTATKKDLQLVADSRPNATMTSTNTLAVKRSTAQSATEVVVESVKNNRTFELNPIREPGLTDQTLSKMPILKVRVVGTYYPKGIYQQPASYSTLLMRAAPGTLFELEHLANDWYKIITGNGIGYLRKDDGKIVSQNAQL